MRVFGLTGGIASGKSTVSDMLRALGAPVVDADRLARKVVEPGSPALAEIAARFGPDVLDAEGRLDRPRMARRVFSDPAARAELEAITHPRIAAAGAEAFASLAAAGHRVAIYEAPLLVERRLHEGMAGVIVVSVPEEVQLERLTRRDGLDEAAARARIAAQLPLADKIAVARWVVDNSGTLEQTRAQVEAIWREIQGEVAS